MKKKRAFYYFLPSALIVSFLVFNTNPVSATSISSFSVSSNKVNIDVSPSGSGNGVNTGSQTATIKTDCSSGYKVYVSMSSDSQDNKLHLNGQSSNNTSGTNAINSVSSNMSSMDTLTSNSWGVRPGTGNTGSTFAAVPTYSSISVTNQSANPTALISSSSAASTGASHTITYGVNAGTSLIPGEYSGKVLYTAIMNSSCYTAEVSVTKGTGIASVSLDGTNPTSITNGQKATYTIGSTATASYTLNPGYHYSSWNSNPAVSFTISNTAGSGTTTGSGSGSFTVPGQNVSISPQGAANTYTIKYNAGASDSGAVGTASQNGTYGGNIITSTQGTLSKTGYSFKGWSHTNNATTATYNANTTVAVSTVASNANVTNTNNAEINLYAVWSINSYDISMTRGYLGSSDTTTSGTYNYGTQVDIRANPDTGYHFTSWSSSNGGSFTNANSATTKFTLGASNTTLTANQAANSYSVVFNGCSNTGGSMSNQSFTYGTAQNLTANGFSRTGYSFVGWATDSCSGSKVYNNSANVNNLTATNGGTVNLYAVWSIQSYTLTTTNGDTANISAVTAGGSKQYNSEVAITCTPKTGYSCYWYNGDTKVSTGNTYTFNMPASNLTLTAKASINSYTLTTTNGDTTNISAVTAGGTKQYNSEVTITCTPNTGYSCYWYDSANTKVSNSSTYTFNMPAIDYTLTAKASINSYSISMTRGYLGTTGATTSGTYDYGTQVDIRANPDAGYHFTSWSSSNGGSFANYQSSSTKYTLGASDTILTANQAANTYSVKFNGCSNTGGAMNNQSFTYGTAQNLTSNGFSRSGYIFAGWATSSCSGTKVYDNGASANNLTTTDGGTYNLYALWSANSYTVTVSGGYIGTSGTTTSGNYTYGSTINIRSASIANGYHFSGWSSSNGGSFANSSNSSTTFTVGAGSTTLTASTAANSYTIRFYDNISNTTTEACTIGTTTNTGDTITIGGSDIEIPVHCSPPKTGYNMIGWSLSSSATSASYTEYQTVSVSSLAQSAGWPANGSTIKLYAIWKYADPNTVTYIQDFTSAHCTNLNGATTLEDKRDTLNKMIYVVKRGGICYTMDDNNGGVGPFSERDQTLSTDTSAGSGSLYLKSYAYSSSIMTFKKNGEYETFNQPAAQAVCPKGWRLPTQSQMNTFMSYMQANEPGELWMQVATGASAYTDVGSSGEYYYWTSTSSSSNYGKAVRIYGSGTDAVYYTFDDIGKDKHLAVMCMQYAQ